MLDNFEEASLREANPGANDYTRYLWSVMDYGAGTTGLTTGDKSAGNKSLLNHYVNGDPEWQFQFYPNTISGGVNHYQYARYFVLNGPWVLNKINRLRFWFKVPSGVSFAGGGDNNFQFGTFLRCTTCDVTSSESDNMHYYHHFDFTYTGQWEQVIIDMHPNHQRSADSNVDEGVLVHPDGEQDYNYFDLLTRFYLHFPYLSLPNADFYMDNFEFYYEPNPENENQVYSIHGTFVPSSNTIRIGWQRNKAENTVKHDVRYSFSDIHSIGWDTAIAAPGGTGIVPPGWGGYNGMYYSTNSIDVSGRSVMYIAVKPQNSSLFKQIAIPISGGTPATTVQAPTAPSGLVVQ